MGVLVTIIVFHGLENNNNYKNVNLNTTSKEISNNIPYVQLCIRSIIVQVFILTDNLT